jgi:hypothetical protein
MTGSELDRATLELLDRTKEVDMRTPRRDGSESSRPIWVVVVDGDVYVRSYRGARGAWFRRALADGRATIAVHATTVPVGVEPDDDEEVNRRVSEAFQAKYGEGSPESTATMIDAERSATTLRLVPAVP